MIVDKAIANAEKSALMVFVDEKPALPSSPFAMKSAVGVDRDGGDVTERNEAATSTEMPIIDSTLMDLLMTLKKFSPFSLWVIKTVFE